ncbi:MAG: helix-turn-helix domain-containing protein, partial [Sphingomonas bacterium]
MTDLAPELLTVRIKEACRISGIGRSKLYELIEQGDIEIIKVGSITLIPVDGLRRFLKGLSFDGDEPVPAIPLSARCHPGPQLLIWCGSRRRRKSVRSSRRRRSHDHLTPSSASVRRLDLGEPAVGLL